MRATGAHRGFVLVLVLAVLAMAAAVLSAATLRCHRQVLAAVEARQELQVRWGGLSCQRTVLAAAEEILRKADPKRPSGLAHVRCTIRLGDMAFYLVLADEQAKTNANLLAQRSGTRGLAASLKALQAGCQRQLAADLRPDPAIGPPSIHGAAPATVPAAAPYAQPHPASAQPAEHHQATQPDSAAVASSVFMRPPMWYASFDQIFRVAHPQDLVAPEGVDLAPTSRITCWGDGRVSWARADKVVLRQVLADVLTEAELAQLETLARRGQIRTAPLALAALKLPPERQQAATALLTDSSGCHSLWVVTSASQRRWYRFCVLERSGQTARERQWVYEW